MALRVERHETAVSVDEYLELERRGTVRHEYVGGHMHAFAGATEAHNLIVANFVTALRTAARGTACRVFPSDMMLKAADDLFYYPDVMTVCDPDDIETRYKTRPCTIVEVLSSSTASIDMREKVLAYRRLPSVKSYVIAYQTERRVKTIYREEDGTWWEAEVQGEGNVHFYCPLVDLSLDDIYEDVRFSQSNG